MVLVILSEHSLVFLSLSTIQNIVSSIGLDDAWWTGITVAAMLCLFLIIQSIVTSRKKRLIISEEYLIKFTPYSWAVRGEFFGKNLLQQYRNSSNNMEAKKFKMNEMKDCGFQKK